MANANESNFLEAGTGAFGPSATVPVAPQRPALAGDQPNPANPGGISDNELRRRERALLESSNVAAQGRQNLLDSGEKQMAAAPGKWGTSSTTESRGATANYDSNVFTDIGQIWGSDPITTAVLAAPYAVGAAGALIPAAAGTAGAAAATPAITTGGAVTGGTMAAPTALGGAGAAGAAGAAGGAAAAGGLSLATGLGLAGLGLDAAGIVASQIRTKAENDLIEKQKQLAEAAKARQIQVQKEGMNRLGTQLQAMVPLNKAMADMYGPGAAFSGQQMGAMAADPGANQAAAGQAFDNNNPGQSQFSMEEIARANADQARQQQVAGAFGPTPQGPAPLQQRKPQAARTF